MTASGLVSHFSPRLSASRGQALAEFNIAAAFVLLPVFLLIPLVGKYIDLRHSSVQTARTVAWERTVWFEQTGAVDTVPKGSGAPARSAEEIERVALQRVMTAPDRGFLSDDWTNDIVASGLNPFWKDHRGEQLVLLNTNTDIARQGNDQNLPGKAYIALRTFDRVESSVNSVLAYGDEIGDRIEDALSLLGLNVDIPDAPQVDLIGKYHLEGYYSPVVRMPIRNVERLASFGGTDGPFDSLDLVMRGQAALIADGWTAEGSAQFADWTDDYVPTRAIRGILKPFQKVASIPVVGHPELDTDSLEFGKIHMGPVPSSDVAPSCPKGACTYE